MPKTDRLEVWFHGVHVADFAAPKAPWRIECRYTAEALERWPGNAPLLSCSLPLSARRLDASVFCAGLLPEGQHRQAFADRAGLATNNVFGLLRRYGRDVAGAVVIADPDTEAASGVPGAVPYTPEELALEVDALDEHPLGLHDDSELSLAGLQDKLLLIDLGDGRWGRPVHGRPSTHILKVDDRLRPGLVAAEADCLRLARHVGLTTVDVACTVLAGVECLIVSRFDRVIGADGLLTRLHQEDLCQALARDPDANGRRGKYERYGGPTLAEAAALLDRYGADPAGELDRLVAATAFTVIVGNADSHGKNLGLLHPTATTVELAPLYDTVPTLLWPKLRDSLAMSIAGHWSLDDIGPETVAAEAARWPHDHRRARRVALDVAERTLAAATELLDPESAVRSLVVQRAQRFLAGG